MQLYDTAHIAFVTLVGLRGGGGCSVSVQIGICIINKGGKSRLPTGSADCWKISIGYFYYYLLRYRINKQSSEQMLCISEVLRVLGPIRRRHAQVDVLEVSYIHEAVSTARMSGQLPAIDAARLCIM